MSVIKQKVWAIQDPGQDYVSRYRDVEYFASEELAFEVLGSDPRFHNWPFRVAEVLIDIVVYDSFDEYVQNNK